MKFDVKVTQEGNEKKCNPGEVAVINYTGRLKSDNSVFDSTEKSGTSFTFVMGQAEVIQCWDMAFKQLNVGSKATLECPAELAYGDVMKPGIPENSDLEFDVELLACAADELENDDIKQMAASADI